jgi:ABC-type glycerol-3-phosphate transport system substrate-binding protein
MYLMGNWIVSSLKSNYPEFPLDIMLFPIIPGGKGDPTMLGAALQDHWCISEASKHKKEAMDLLRFMFKKENIIKYINDQKQVGVNLLGINILLPNLPVFIWIM